MMLSGVKLLLGSLCSFLGQETLVTCGGGGGGGLSHKNDGMLVVSLMGSNRQFWSRLGCSGQNFHIFSCQGIF